jgi:hypothetical protein
MTDCGKTRVRSRHRRQKVRGNSMRRAFAGFAAATFIAVATVAIATVAKAGPVQANEPRAAPVVVELFTSQGCSSCPPADAFLTDLARQRRDVLPLAFHVTYWDYLGWKDPYSFDAATARQRAYARFLGQDGVYTPQMVVDGATEFVGSSRSRGLEAIAGAARKPVTVGLTREGANLLVTIGDGPGHGQVLLVGFDPVHETRIGRGENGGRTLTESNIVRSLTPLGNWSGSATSLRSMPAAGEAFAALLQGEDGHIIGAARLGS